MSIQYVEDFYVEDNYTQDEEQEDILTFSNIVFKDDILQMYLKDIGKTKLLKRAEEQELGKQIL